MVVFVVMLLVVVVVVVLLPLLPLLLLLLLLLLSYVVLPGASEIAAAAIDVGDDAVVLAQVSFPAHESAMVFHDSSAACISSNILQV